MISSCTFEKVYIREGYCGYVMLEWKRMKYKNGLLIPVESLLRPRLPKIIGDYTTVNLILRNTERNKGHYVLIMKNELWE